MKFDVIIIGGGLSGLVCGISLQKQGKKCAIVSAGQSALHFSSGYFDLLGRTPDGKTVDVPAEAIDSLPASHPYRKIGAADFRKYCSAVKPLFEECGVSLKGDPDKNCLRITPAGEVKPSWLCLGEFTPFETSDADMGKKVLVVNIPGYLDFNAAFIASGIEKRGAQCRIVDITTDEIAKLRRNPSEMRAANIGRVMDRPDVADGFVKAVRAALKDEDAVVLPAVFGLKDASVPGKVAEAIGVRTEYVTTMPPSVPGIRTQMRLKTAFENLGGAFLAGDTVDSATVSDGRVESVGTANFGSERLFADDFVLASGSFFSKGLAAEVGGISEPVFGLDIDCLDDRAAWADRSFFKKQNYMGFGVKSDDSFRAVKDGKSIENLYAAGSVAGGCHPISEGSGAGTAIMSALCVADRIMSKRGK